MGGVKSATFGHFLRLGGPGQGRNGRFDGRGARREFVNLGGREGQRENVNSGGREGQRENVKT